MLVTGEYLVSIGFTITLHKVLGVIYEYNLGRRRMLKVCCIGTGNEMVHIAEYEHDGSINLITAHNFDYDGRLSTTKILSLIIAITGKTPING